MISKNSGWSISSNIFFVCCLLSTVGLQIYCIFRYAKDENSTEVKYTKFHHDEDAMYPSLTFCFKDPFLEEKFQQYEDDINVTRYINFLKGNLWNENMLEVKYDDVTISLSDHLLGTYLQTHKKEIIEWIPHYYVSFRSGYLKCFAVDQPVLHQKYILTSGLLIRKSIFHQSKISGVSSTSDISSPDAALISYLHYPGQRLTAGPSIKKIWPLRQKSDENYVIRFDIKNMDVITRRNKYHDNCIVDWKQYDKHILDKFMVNMKCRPPHWNITSKLPLCSNATEMKRFAKAANVASNDYEPPCKSIARIDYNYSELDEKYIDRRVINRYRR